MSLADRLREPAHRGRCRVGRLLLNLDDPDRDALVRVLEDPSWSVLTIRHALSDEGYPLSEWSVRQHRVGSCTGETCGMPDAGVRR